MINDFRSSDTSEPNKQVSEQTSSKPNLEPIEAPLVEPAPAAEEPQEAPEAQAQEAAALDKSAKATKTKRKPHLWPVGWSEKKKRIFSGILAALIVLLVAGGYYWYQQSHKAPTTKKSQTKATVAKPTTVASPLTGVQVSPALAKRSVTGVMIENSVDARPQSGLLDAGVVYEAVAEGGITRFLALFQETNPGYVGPIRSSRPYYLDWLLPFDAAYAHVGGSPEALSQIKDLHVKDLDQFANGGSYDRVTSRYAPHNVYTSIDRLYDLAQKKGYGTSQFSSLPRKAKETPAATPTAKTVDLAISGPLFNAHYDYNAPTNSYLRSEGGKPHTDEKSGKQLSPKVVVALVMSSAIEADGSHNSYTTTGSGAMYVFQDGLVTQGTWKKDSRTSQFTFMDTTGRILGLNPGQTWISIVNTAGSVTYKP